MLDKAVVKDLPEGVGEIDEPEKTPKEIKEDEIKDFGGESQIMQPGKPRIKDLQPNEKNISS